MDKIFVENLVVIGKHGVMKHEWSHEQRFLVDIVTEFDVSVGAKTDDLADTLNYVHLCDIARKTIEGASVYLIEKLAVSIAEQILEDKRVAEVTVTIRKPTVLPSGVPGVTITRKQS